MERHGAPRRRQVVDLNRRNRSESRRAREGPAAFGIVAKRKTATVPASPPDPCDIGALLTRAAAAHAPPLTPAAIARLTGMAPPNVSRALRSPDTRPNVARRILLAIGATLDVRGADPPPT